MMNAANKNRAYEAYVDSDLCDEHGDFEAGVKAWVEHETGPRARIAKIFVMLGMHEDIAFKIASELMVDPE